jgi:RNA polymerase sigma-70 factor (ECF subfamily)
MHHPNPTQDPRAAILQEIYRIAYHLALQYLRDEHAARDIAQEACARAIPLLRAPQQHENPPAWAVRTARNLCVDHHRRCERRAKREQRVAEDRPKSSESASEEPEREERSAQLRLAIDELAPDLRRPFLLHYFEDLSQEEIARLEGVSAPTIPRRLRAALPLLKQILERPRGNDGRKEEDK